MEKYTAESLFNGRLRLFQPEKGYRYTIDPLILCSQIEPPPHTRILDIGCGCGIMPQILAFRHEVFVTGVEIQHQLAYLAEKNIKANRMEARVTILHQDISNTRRSDTGGRFDHIISNPPYKKEGTGRINPDPQKAVARHELTLTIPTLLAKAEELLNPRGDITIIFPAERLFDIRMAMDRTTIRPSWIRFIHAAPKKNAMRVIVSGTKDTKSSCRVRPPLYLYDGQGNPTKEHLAVINA